MPKLLIQSHIDKPIVFIGDLHGELTPLYNILEKYPPGPNRLVFLGDYIDRGPHSFEVLGVLQLARATHPEDVILLMGNHDYGNIINCCGDFWEDERSGEYAKFLNNLPIAACLGDEIICTHACIPNIADINAINRLQRPVLDLGSTLPSPIAKFVQTLWADIEEEGGSEDVFTRENIRQSFTPKYITTILNKLNKTFLIRGHQPYAPTIQHNRIITLISTNLYQNPLIAVLNKEENITIEDFKLFNPYFPGTVPTQVPAAQGLSPFV